MNLGRALLLGAVCSAGLPASPVLAHDFKVGELLIDHPYALPTPDGARTGAVYFRALKNTGRQADRLISADTASAGRVQIHHMRMDGNVVRMDQVDGLDLAPQSELKMRHGADWHLMLIDLKGPLKSGDRFKLLLHFKQAGDKEVVVIVQQVRADEALPHTH